MPVSHLGIIESNEAPPPLDLVPVEVTALADERVHDHAVCADLSYRKGQAQWGYQDRQGRLLPIGRKSIAPMALALDGGDRQGRQQMSGQGQWQAEVWRPPPWSLVDERLGEADGVCIVAGSDVPKRDEQAGGGRASGAAAARRLVRGRAPYAARPPDTRRWLRRPPTAPQGPPAPRRADAAMGRSTRRSAAPRGVAPLPDQRRQTRASDGRVRLPTRAGAWTMTRCGVG
jgi:hypothetical protein